jgi:hypothetical protein
VKRRHTLLEERMRKEISQKNTHKNQRIKQYKVKSDERNEYIYIYRERESERERGCYIPSDAT